MTSERSAIELHGSVWMTVGGENFGGLGRINLLAAIADCGSITQAAKLVKMSYKAAWDAIDNMNNLAGEPLVERLSGGKGGGGTRLTRRGLQLVENFRIIEREHQRFIEQLGQQADGIADDLLLIRRMNMKTSARNQFLGTVVQVKRGAVNDEIVLELAAGQKIVATITHESTETLGLTPGVQAFALIKASSIILVADDERAKFSTSNRMSGNRRARAARRGQYRGRDRRGRRRHDRRHHYQRELRRARTGGAAAGDRDLHRVERDPGDTGLAAAAWRAIREEISLQPLREIHLRGRSLRS